MNQLRPLGVVHPKHSRAIATEGSFGVDGTLLRRSTICYCVVFSGELTRFYLSYIGLSSVEGLKGGCVGLGADLILSSPLRILSVLVIAPRLTDPL